MRTLILACNDERLAVAAEALLVRGERLVERTEHATFALQPVEQLADR